MSNCRVGTLSPLATLRKIIRRILIRRIRHALYISISWFLYAGSIILYSILFISWPLHLLTTAEFTLQSTLSTASNHNRISRIQGWKQIIMYMQAPTTSASILFSSWFLQKQQLIFTHVTADSCACNRLFTLFNRSPLHMQQLICTFNSWFVYLKQLLLFCLTAAPYACDSSNFN